VLPSNLANPKESQPAEITQLLFQSASEEGSVEKILALPRLRHLKIVVTRPNPDDLADDYAAVMKRLADQKARTLTQELQKAPKGDRLIPDADTQSLAKIAGTNGYVEGVGKDAHDSTKSHPKRRWIEVAKDGSSIVRFLTGFVHF